MGVAVSCAMLAIGAVLAVAVDGPETGVNLQTLGLLLMLVGVTALNVVMTLRESSGDQTEASPRRGSQTL